MLEKKSFDKIQAGILRPHGRKHTVFLFFTFQLYGGYQDKNKEWLKLVANKVSTHSDHCCHSTKFRAEGENNSLSVSLALTKLGTLLSVQNSDFSFLDELVGLKKFGNVDYFPRKKTVARIHGEYGGVVSVSGNDENEIQALVDEFKKSYNETAVNPEVALQVELGLSGAKYDSGVNIGNFDPFGFKDGISDQRTPEEVFTDAFFIEDEAAVEPTYGSYMAFLKFETKKDEFDRYIDKLVAKMDWEQSEEVKKKYAQGLIMGRFQNGDLLSEFDPAGNHCPFFSHTKAVVSMLDEDTPSIVRRSVSFITPKAGSEEEFYQGLYFISFQKSLKSQFAPVLEGIELNEDILLYKKKNSGKRAARDLTTDTSVDATVLPHNGRINDMEFWRHEPDMVDFKGEQYFWLPSIRFLEEHFGRSVDSQIIT